MVTEKKKEIDHNLKPAWVQKPLKQFFFAATKTDKFQSKVQPEHGNNMISIKISINSEKKQ